MSNIFGLDDKNLIETIYKAAKEYAALTGKSFIFVGKNKKTVYGNLNLGQTGHRKLGHF